MHQCEFCSYATIRKDNMQKHVDNMHEMEGEEYECEKCDFVTRRKGKMKTHMVKVLIFPFQIVTRGAQFCKTK